MQGRRNSMDNALELRLYCTNPSISYLAIYSYFHPAIWWSDFKDQHVSNKQRRLQCRIIGNLPIKLSLNLGVIDYHRPILYHSRPILYHSASNTILIISNYSAYRWNNEWYSNTHNVYIYRTCRAPAHITTNPCRWLNTKLQNRQCVSKRNASSFIKLSLWGMLSKKASI